MLACAGFEKRTATSGIFGYNTSKKGKIRGEIWNISLDMLQMVK